MKFIKLNSDENVMFIDAIEETIKYIRDEENLKFNTQKDIGQALEINFRIWHFFLWDFKEYRDFLDNLSIDNEVIEAFKDNTYWLFRIIYSTKEYVIIEDLISKKELKITWEFEWSDKSILDLPIWSEVISRIIKYKNEFYLLKNYYYFITEENKYLSNSILDFFQKNKFKFDLYILEKFINEITKLVNEKNKISEINYYKRLTNSLKEVLPNKKLREAIKLIDKNNFNSYVSLFELLNQNFVKIDNLTKIINNFMDYIEEDNSFWDTFKYKITFILSNSLFLTTLNKNKNISKKFSYEDKKELLSLLVIWNNDEILEEIKKNWITEIDIENKMSILIDFILNNKDLNQAIQDSNLPESKKKELLEI